MQRRTRQRDAIWRVFQDAGRPLGPAEVLSTARSNVTRLGIATVYRAIGALRDEGLLVAVEIPGQPPCYEIAGLTHHHHFYCKLCGRVYEMEGCLLKDGHPSPPGFRVESHEVTLYGKCADCA